MGMILSLLLLGLATQPDSASLLWGQGTMGSSLCAGMHHGPFVTLAAPTNFPLEGPVSSGPEFCSVTKPVIGNGWDVLELSFPGNSLHGCHRFVSPCAVVQDCCL